MENRRILVIDDDREIWQAYEDVLTRPNGGAVTDAIGKLLGGQPHEPNLPEFALSFAGQGQEGLHLAEEALAQGSPFAVAFIDIRMPPGWDGMETASRIRRIDPNVELVIVTAYSDRSRYEIVEAVGAPDKLLFLRKPFDPEELYQLALSLTAKWNIAKREQESRRALESSEARFRNLVETSSDWVWEIDATGVFTYCSPVCEMIYGYRPETLLGRDMAFLAADTEEAQRLESMIRRHAKDILPFQAWEHRCRRKDGEVVIVESSAMPVVNDSGVVVGFRGIDRDITERRRHEEERRQLESRLSQAQKMEAIGTLAGGIAHDLNNILTPILGYAEMAIHQTQGDKGLNDKLRIIHQAALKGAGLIRQILAFSRRQPLVKQVIDINQRIKENFTILRRLIREDIELRLELADQPWPICADVNQLEQILINLLANARDAVDEAGKITIRTQNVTVAQGELEDEDHQPMRGDYVLLEVQDNGCGMEEATRRRIFEPFFTTKQVGKGTGLGLATVYGIVRQHGGHVRLTSRPGEGTTFSIYFRRCQQDTDDTTADNLVEASVAGGNETILVAEDDETVLAFVSATLEQLGYRVIAAANGVEAVNAFTRAGRIDLLLADMVMPGMGGSAVAARLRQAQPGLPVVYMSGYPCDEATRALLDAANTTFLAKPFLPAALARTIREALDRKNHS